MTVVLIDASQAQKWPFGQATISAVIPVPLVVPPVPDWVTPSPHPSDSVTGGASAVVPPDGAPSAPSGPRAAATTDPSASAAVSATPSVDACQVGVHNGPQLQGAPPTWRLSCTCGGKFVGAPSLPVTLEPNYANDAVRRRQALVDKLKGRGWTCP